MKTLCVFIMGWLGLFFSNPNMLMAQAQALSSETQVEVLGFGQNRNDALQDALRNAVGEAAGVALVAETSMENFVVLKDAISTRTEGYVTAYQVISEGAKGENYEINIRASVSLEPLKADAEILARAIGGVRFLVMYDDRGRSAEEREIYDHAVDQVNAYLSQNGYRYIDNKRFQQLKNEARGIFEDSRGANEESYVQHLGLMADAQFIIFIRDINKDIRSEAFDTRTAKRISLNVRAYDNCTAEGLGTVNLKGEWSSSRSADEAMRSGINSAVNQGLPELLRVFNSYIGNWVNNGTPFELRFYESGSFRDFRDLRNKIVNDSKFGGQIEITAFDNYMKLNINFLDRPDDLAYLILDYADEVPHFKNKRLDVRLIYGRQINFAPQNTPVPELDKVKERKDE